MDNVIIRKSTPMQRMPFVVLQLQLQSQSVSPDSAHSLIP